MPLFGLCDYDILVLLTDDPPRERLVRMYDAAGEELHVRPGNLEAALAHGWIPAPLMLAADLAYAA